MIETPPSSLFEGQFRSWHLRGFCCCQACSRYVETQRRGPMGSVHLLFIYKLAAPHHVKLTPLMGSCLSGSEDRHSPAKATYWLPDDVVVHLRQALASPGLVLKSAWCSAGQQRSVPWVRMFRKYSLQGLLRLQRPVITLQCKFLFLCA